MRIIDFNRSHNFRKNKVWIWFMTWTSCKFINIFRIRRNFQIHIHAVSCNINSFSHNLKSIITIETTMRFFLMRFFIFGFAWLTNQNWENSHGRNFWKRSFCIQKECNFVHAGLSAHFAEQMKKGISELSEYFEWFRGHLLLRCVLRAVVTTLFDY